MTHDVFISHSEHDARMALELALGLEQNGFSTWSYEIDRVAGASYLLQTHKAISIARIVVLIISRSSVGSGQVTKEVVRAHECDKEFMPLLIDLAYREFCELQPEWQEALGSSTAIELGSGSAVTILPDVMLGLQTLGVRRQNPDDERLARIRSELDKVVERSSYGPNGEPPLPGVKRDEIDKDKSGSRSTAKKRVAIVAAVVALALLALGIIAVVTLDARARHVTIGTEPGLIARSGSAAATESIGAARLERAQMSGDAIRRNNKAPVASKVQASRAGSIVSPEAPAERRTGYFTRSCYFNSLGMGVKAGDQVEILDSLTQSSGVPLYEVDIEGQKETVGLALISRSDPRTRFRMTTPETLDGYLVGRVSGGTGGFESVEEVRFRDASEGNVLVRMHEIATLEIRDVHMTVRMRDGKVYDGLLEYMLSDGTTVRARRTFEFIAGKKALELGKLAEEEQVKLERLD
jgi:hypothetical protein